MPLEEVNERGWIIVVFNSKWLKWCEYLPPLVRFCDAIVGRMMPPREFGASGSESLCENSLKKNFNSCVSFQWKFLIDANSQRILRHDLVVRSMRFWYPFHAKTFYLIGRCSVLLLHDLNWLWFDCLQSVYMNVNFVTWNLWMRSKHAEYNEKITSS